MIQNVLLQARHFSNNKAFRSNLKPQPFQRFPDCLLHFFIFQLGNTIIAFYDWHNPNITHIRYPIPTPIICSITIYRSITFFPILSSAARNQITPYPAVFELLTWPTSNHIQFYTPKLTSKCLEKYRLSVSFCIGELRPWNAQSATIVD